MEVQKRSRLSHWPHSQDFHALFGVGHDSTTISTIDPAGIALAAIKELDKRTRDIDVLKSQLADLQRQVGELRRAGE